MVFLSLYRKYRPANFNDLVGQNHVVKTLRNALANDRVAHAYLFAGPRGTGKTSTAKVFAMALNCEDESSLEPCGQCKTCENIETGQSIDVIEIDAASNRGIDEIRDLREKVKFYPSEGDYKVYIIDEVHMLTTGAFNALLKTLEEPPKNVIFILATTEPHKVITTILSRCQRFDFSLLSVKDIQERLAYICREEGVEYEDEALNIIAHSSNGGLRDAISILDQAISFTSGDINTADLQQMLGKVDKEVLSRFIKYIINNNTADALGLVNELINRGKGVARFVADLIEYSRQLLLIKECGINSGLLEFSRDRLELLQQVSRSVEGSVLTRVIDILTGIEQDLKFTNKPRLILEVGIVKMTSPATDKSPEGLVTRVAELEKQLKEIKVNGSVKSVGNKKEARKDESRKTPAAGSGTGDDRGKISPVEPDNADKSVEPESGDESEEDRAVATDTSGQVVDGEDAVLTIDRVRKNWPAILGQVKKDDITTHAFLIEGKPVKVEDGIIYIQFPEDKNFHKKSAEQKQDLIKRICSRILASTCQLCFTIAGEDLDISESGKKKLENEEIVDNVDDNDDLINKVVEMFEGEVIKVNDNFLE